MLVGAGRENSSTEASGRYRERSPGVEDMASTLTDEEEGKTVVDASGEPLGLITTVEEDAAYVEPNPDLAESIAARLGGETPRTTNTPSTRTPSTKPPTRRSVFARSYRSEITEIDRVCEPEDPKASTAAEMDSTTTAERGLKARVAVSV
jgi:hypothetical protein